MDKIAKTYKRNLQSTLLDSPEYDFGRHRRSLKNESETAKKGQVRICYHKDIFPLFQKELLGMVAVLIALFGTNIGGAPGAGFVIPISTFFFNFDVKNAIALSNFSILLSTAIRYALEYNIKNPLRDGVGL
jgi:uncharacterized membrane protein YfcA